MTEFAYYELVREWPELTIAVNELEGRLRRNGRPVAADLLVKGFAEFRASLIRLGRTMSALATETLRSEEKRTRVRPDTMGGGGPRLGDSLVAEPLNEALIPGSIGVANEDVLDRNVPWWLTNEIGSTARVGGRLFGLFYGGGSGDEMPPSADAGARREHPLFTPAPAAAGGGPGLIQNPIPARYFIRDAVPKIAAAWKVQFDAAKSQMMAEMDRAIATMR